MAISSPASARGAASTMTTPTSCAWSGSNIASAIAGVRALEDERRRADGARRARSREDGVLQQCQPRVPHAAHADARTARGPAGEEPEAHAARRPRAARGSAAQWPAAAQARQHAARLRAHRSRPRAGCPINRPTCRADGRSGEQFPLGLRARGHRVSTVDCPPLPEPVYVDQEMWEKIVLNLLSNAFKFTLRGRDLACGCGMPATSVELEVSDTGTGIPADELPRMFERFHRVEDARGRSHEGSGIGLALVSELVKLHGGSITVHSKLGDGTTFTVAIPKGSAHLPPSASRRRDAACRSTAARADAYVAEALGWLPAERGTSPASVRTGAPRVLVADDNADLREYVRRLLGRALRRRRGRRRPGRARGGARAAPIHHLRRDDAAPRRVRADPRAARGSGVCVRFRSFCSRRAPAKRRASRASARAPTTIW